MQGESVETHSTLHQLHCPLLLLCGGHAPNQAVLMACDSLTWIHLAVFACYQLYMRVQLCSCVLLPP
jgi:hypothetical protein